MAEETMFRGLWTCPGYGWLVCGEYECDGIELTMEGAQAMTDELMRAHAEHVKLN